MGLHTSFLVLIAGLVYACAQEEIRTPASFIVNGVNTSANRYPYYVSLRYKFNRARNSTASPVPYCGASLISDRLVLTAGHCVGAEDFLPYMGSARPANFRQLGLNFTSFPNTYVVNSTTLQLSAFVGAESRAVSGGGIPIAAWFLHPWFDPTNLFYDVAVGLLSQPVNATPVKLYSAPADIYSSLASTVNLTAIGLGDVITDDYNTILRGLNRTTPDRNNDTRRVLEETNIGSLVPRVLCGKAITAAQQRNSTSGTGNTAFGALATVVSPGQMCVGVASNEAIDRRMRAEAARIAASAQGSLPSSIREDLLDKGINYTNPDSIFKLLDGYNDTCQGDSGGPILVKGQTAADDVQVGTVSFGVGCGAGIAGVYEAVQNYMNSTVFDSFLRDIITAVSASRNPSNLVTAIPTNLTSAG